MNEMPLTFSKQTFAQQLAERLEEVIRLGRWPAGEKTPPIRKVAEEYMVSARTAQMALLNLQKKGFLVRQPTSGRMVVAEDIDAMAPENHYPKTSVQQTSHANVPVQQIAMLGAHHHRASAADNWSGQIFLGAETTLVKTTQFCATRIHSMEYDSSKRAKQMAEQLEYLAPQLSGAIIFQDTVEIELSMMEQLDKLGLPWVTINRPLHDMMHNFVSADNLAIGKMAGHLFNMEQRSPIWILDMQATFGGGNVSHAAKVTGLYEACMHSGKPFPDIKYLPCAGTSTDIGFQKIHKELKAGPPPQAIYTTGDFLAIGAINACQEFGLKVPDDIWIIGTTGLEAARLNNPSLTVIPQPMEQMGRTAADMLIRMIQTGEMRLPGKLIKSKLILRGSTKVSKKTREQLTEQGLIEGKETNHEI